MEHARILIIDDEQANVRFLELLLKRQGYDNLEMQTDPRWCRSICEDYQPDLLLLDLHMPDIDGFQLLGEFAGVPDESRPAILVLTADVTPAAKHRAFSLGADDFLTKPLDAVEVVIRTKNLLRSRFLAGALRKEKEVLEERVQERTRALENSQIELLARLAQAAEFRDQETGDHTYRVGELAALLARELGMSDEDCETLRLAAPLHDVGKIAIPDSILLKPGRLSDGEMAVMKTHTVIGARLLARGQSRLMAAAEEIALSHHEKWDGSGYPNGLHGEQIPAMGRIVALADFYDALSHDRPYRGAWPSDRIRDEIRLQDGTHFDPMVVEAFESLFPSSLPTGT